MYSRIFHFPYFKETDNLKSIYFNICVVSVLFLKKYVKAQLKEILAQYIFAINRFHSNL
jgi:hypothetical protein